MLRIVPLHLRAANTLVARLHRHHKPAQGNKFSIGVINDRGILVGAAICGRPVARNSNQYTTLEVTRLVTDGTPNACSILYAACARIAREMGYYEIQTYILASETGHSLKVSGWELDSALTGGGQWVHTDGKPRREDQPICPKQRWHKILCKTPPNEGKPPILDSDKDGGEKQLEIW